MQKEPSGPLLWQAEGSFYLIHAYLCCSAFGSSRCDASMSVRLYMSQNVNQPAKWIANVETPNAPWLINRPILYGETSLLHAFKRIIDIINLNRQVRCRRAAAPCEAKLI